MRGRSGRVRSVVRGGKWWVLRLGGVGRGGVWIACSFGRSGTYLRIVVLGGGGGHVGIETARMGYVGI